MRQALLLAVLAVVTPSLSAQSEHPWTLDDATRVARRFDPKLAAERAAASESCRVNGCVGTIIVEGKRNPELLMPWELMSHVPDAFHPDPIWVDASRSHWSSRVGLKSYSPFWEELYEAGKPYFDAERRIVRLRAEMKAVSLEEQPVLMRELEDVQRTLCSLRAEALANARLVFGRCPFDRFLYEAIAPDLSVASRDETAATTLWVEGGCW